MHRFLAILNRKCALTAKIRDLVWLGNASNLVQQIAHDKLPRRIALLPTHAVELRAPQAVLERCPATLDSERKPLPWRSRSSTCRTMAWNHQKVEVLPSLEDHQAGQGILRRNDELVSGPSYRIVPNWVSK